MTSGVNEWASKQANGHNGARKRDIQGRASEWLSGEWVGSASKRANRRASEPVLTSWFLAVLNHCGMFGTWLLFSQPNNQVLNFRNFKEQLDHSPVFLPSRAQGGRRSSLQQLGSSMQQQKPTRTTTSCFSFIKWNQSITKKRGSLISVWMLCVHIYQQARHWDPLEKRYVVCRVPIWITFENVLERPMTILDTTYGFLSVQ